MVNESYNVIYKSFVKKLFIFIICCKLCKNYLIVTNIIYLIHRFYVCVFYIMCYYEPTIG